MVEKLIRFVKRFLFGPKRVVEGDIAKAEKSRLNPAHSLLKMQGHRRSRIAAHSLSTDLKFNYDSVRQVLSSKTTNVTSLKNAERQQSLYSAA